MDFNSLSRVPSWASVHIIRSVWPVPSLKTCNGTSRHCRGVRPKMSLDSLPEGLLILAPIILLLVVGAVIALRSGVHDLSTGQGYLQIAGNLSRMLLGGGLLCRHPPDLAIVDRASPQPWLVADTRAGFQA